MAEAHPTYRSFPRLRGYPIDSKEKKHGVARRPPPVSGTSGSLLSHRIHVEPGPHAPPRHPTWDLHPPLPENLPHRRRRSSSAACLHSTRCHKARCYWCAHSHQPPRLHHALLPMALALRCPAASLSPIRSTFLPSSSPYPPLRLPRRPTGSCRCHYSTTAMASARTMTTSPSSSTMRTSRINVSSLSLSLHYIPLVATL
jgi:hypothetical protein